jgi:hypothetical protein
MKKLYALSIIFFALAIGAMSQECPTGLICITPSQARVALENVDKVDALTKENLVLTQAISDLKSEVNKIRVEYAEKVGENTALKQNSISDRAIIEILLKSAKPKKFGLINF